MMWHFYEIPYIPDLELVKYQSLGEQGIDGILERHNRFLRQWQRNTVLIHTTLHFFLSYTHERPKGSRLQIFLAFSSDQTVNFESIDALMQASPLADYYKIAPIEDVPVCLRKSFANILLVKKQEQTRLSTGDTLFTVEGWKSNPKSRLYEMEKTAEALNEDMVYHISIYGSDTYKTAQQALQKPIAILREKALGRSGQITLADNKNRPRDVSAEETLRIYEEFLSDVAKSPCFFANILLYANQKSSAHFLMDAVCGEAIKEGTCEIQEIPSTATPLELQEVNQPYCNLLPPSLAFWPTAYTLDELSSFFRLPILFDGENIEIKKETAPKLEQTGIYLGQTNNGLSAFIDASSFKKHAFICGVPGSGKTNTMLHLANSLWHHKKLIKDDTDNLSVTFKEESDPIPFLVLEPAKREYRELSRDAMQVYLDKYLHENFGDLYTTKIKNCGAVLSNEVEYEPSVYIEATDSAKYPWLSFVVTGEQLTMTQVSFAIYALYLPTKDFQCTQAVDTIEQNQKYQNRLITLKQAQNPKIKNYIESINEILISGLEAWLNNNNTSSMYD